MGAGGGVEGFCGPASDPRRYRITSLEPIAEQGEGWVFRGTAASEGVAVAVKQLRDEAFSRFEQIKDRHDRIAAVNHPHLAAHVEAFVGTIRGLEETIEPNADDDVEVFVVSEWIEGKDFDPAERSIDAVRQVILVGHALTTLHNEAGFAHLDVKPSNIRLRDNGDAILIDFGLARALDGSGRSTIIGAPDYMAPEQLRDDAVVSEAADVFAVGAVLRSVLSSEPSEGNRPDSDAMARVASALGVPDPVGLARLAERSLSEDPVERPSAQEWVSAAEECLARRRRRLTRRGKRGLAFAVGLAVIAIGAVGYIASRPGPDTVLVVQNRLVDGPTDSFEDSALVQLVSEPVINCPIVDCSISGTARRSNGTYDSAVCVTTGERVTNGNDRSIDDDSNPLLYESTSYYGVELLVDGVTKRGYVSWVWLIAEDRNGLGLPTCESIDFDATTPIDFDKGGAPDPDIEDVEELQQIVGILDDACRDGDELFARVEQELFGALSASASTVEERVEIVEGVVALIDPNPVLEDLPTVTDPVLSMRLVVIEGHFDDGVVALREAVDAIEQGDEGAVTDAFLSGGAALSRGVDGVRDLGTSDC